MEESTVKSILGTLAKWASERRSIDPQTYMEAASKLNSLLQGEVEILIDLESELAKVKRLYLEEGKSVAYAKSMIEATEGYNMYKKQKAMIDTAKEQILLAKKNASLSSDLMRNQLN